ncbi:hypothetical protein [Qipengyuania sphaerica]|uniref:hypothetical protein n=1 Tax=Qipengyuania sphaerica TaxID=2867243 RepID=UPI001C88A75B|nr:hypothetical protein [Qipengyuania sphaerica]MBX7540606.1 hypothetical protein [Qipengyuania sphaerica]
MDRTIAMGESKAANASDLRRALAQGDAMLAGIEPILGHLLSAPDHSLFSDEIVARVRGMLADLARQVLYNQAEATGERGRDAFAERHGEALVETFQGSSALLLHCHALAIEWQLTQRLEMEAGLDPVLTPLLQKIIADSDPTASSAGMAALAAQARFAQSQRRMELPLGELPGDLFHQTLLSWRHYCGETRSEAVTRAEERLRSAYDESAGRQVLLARLLSLAGGSVGRGALLLDDAGVAIFFTALAGGSQQPRELAILSSHERQIVRMALGLHASGLGPERIDEVLLRLHPGAAPVTGLDAIGQGEARDLLLDASHRLGQG